MGDATPYLAGGHKEGRKMPHMMIISLIDASISTINGRRVLHEVAILH
jgi:hypothetical protein